MYRLLCMCKKKLQNSLFNFARIFDDPGDQAVAVQLLHESPSVLVLHI